VASRDKLRSSVAVTEDAIYVLESSKPSGGAKPKSLVGALPRHTQLGPVSGRWGQVNLLGEVPPLLSRRAGVFASAGSRSRTLGGARETSGCGSRACGHPGLESRPMGDDRLAPVRDQFGDPLPAALHALSDDELTDLTAALAEADREQSIALDAAIDHTLRFLPWPLSSIVRKVLVG